MVADLGSGMKLEGGLTHERKLNLVANNLVHLRSLKVSDMTLGELQANLSSLRRQEGLWDRLNGK